MKILISGASGLVGTHLIPTLKAKGHEIYKLVRKTPDSSDEIRWDAEKGFNETEQSKLENFDAVVHLAGDNVASENWSREKKRRIRDSRVLGTRVLVDALKNSQNPTRIFVAASAVGFYGGRKDEVLTEESSEGEGFLTEVCTAWEDEIEKAETFARVVILRIGVVLAENGGALEKMLTPFKLGVGGVIGSGNQWMSWISLDDLIKIIHFALRNEYLSGAVNAVAPNPVTNKEFTKTLGKVLHRPTILPIPAFAIKLMFGEMGKTLLLEGTRVLPKKLQDAGFEFQFSNLETAIKHVLKD
ncbi:MAG: TIGR01777 family oxidoreductase [Acidobacteria bacterium]|nr:TIGR01777 family oxidoreductase [Acidobacteriota bacterium]MCA1637069.1 TIGR01777 family oxidoreductase [Acidobacteriota bacterium]